MKNLLKLSLVMFALTLVAVGCEMKKEKSNTSSEPTKVEEKKEVRSNEIKLTEPFILSSQREGELFTLDGCEYVKVGTSKRAWGFHKGDCKNPIHQCKCGATCSD